MSQSRVDLFFLTALITSLASSVVAPGPDQPSTFLINLDQHCLRCLCYAASKCNLTSGCNRGYCGPYKISRIYWTDAGEVTLPGDDKERAEAYEDCVQSYPCAHRVITNYFEKYGRDCNDDGVTNCDDYAMINFNGGWQCKSPLNRNPVGRNYSERYRVCNPEY